MNEKFKNDAAIIGMACRFPGASNYAEFWRNLFEGVNSVKEIPSSRWDQEKYYSADGVEGRSHSKWCGVVDDIDQFDARFFGISPREACDMDPQQRLLLEETAHCIEDAGIALQDLQKQRTGVFVGCATGDYQQISSSEDIKKDNYAVLGNYKSVLSNRISYCFNFTGPSITIDTACASSLVALHEAVKALQADECDYAIVGAVNVNIHPWKYVVISQANMLSRDGQCRTFDKNANGYVPGDGVGVVLLQRRQEAEDCRNQVIGLVKGSAVNHNGRSSSISAPSIPAQKELISSVYRKSGISPRTVTYVEAHGTGTSLGDPIEVEALNQAFSAHTEDRGFCRIGSVKSNIGHLEGAAGLAGLVKVLLMMRHGWIPKTLHIETVNPIIEFDKTPFIPAEEACQWTGADPDVPLRASVSAFGFSGSNAYVLIEAPEKTKEERIVTEVQAPSAVPALFTLSARTAKSLTRLIDEWRIFSESDQFGTIPLPDLCATLLNSRSRYEYRFGFAIRDKDDIRRGLKEFELAPQLKQGVWNLFIGECEIAGYDEIEPVLRDWAGLRTQVEALLDRVESQRASFRQPKWPATEQQANALLFEVAYVSALRKLGFAPSIISSSGRGVYVAIVVSGMAPIEVMIPALLSGDFSGVAFNWPAIPVYDGVHGETIHTCEITEEYLQSLRHGADVLPAEVENQVRQARLLLGHQFTFSRYLEEWIETAGRAGLNLRSFVEDTGPGVPGSRLERICFVVASANAVHRVKTKWQLTEKVDIASPALREVLALINDEVLTGEQFVQWITDDGAPLALLVDSMRRAMDGGPVSEDYGILTEINRKARPIADAADWIRRAEEVRTSPPLPELQRLTIAEIPVSLRELRDGVLLKLWLAGVSVQWTALGVEYSKASLPLYPFDRQRYWVQPKEDRVERALHPLLQRNTSDSSGPHFTSTFSGREILLTDHKVGGSSVLPGVAYLEMARKACETATKKGGCTGFQFRSVVWSRPVQVENGPQTLHLGLQPNADGSLDYEIYSDGETPGQRVPHGQGIVATRAFEFVPKLDLARLRSEVNVRRLAGSALYEHYRNDGIEHGPGYQGVRELFVGDGQNLARIVLPETVAPTAADYVLHPSVVDSALQAGVALLWMTHSNTARLVGPMLPFSIAAIEVFGPTCDVMWAWSRFAGAEERSLDIDLCDESGRICMRIAGFSVRRTSERSTTAALSALKPVWTPFANVRTVATDRNSTTLVIGAGEAVAPILTKIFPNSIFAETSSTSKLQHLKPLDHIVWLATGDPPTASLTDELLIESQQTGLLALFNLVKVLVARGDAARTIEWTICTADTQRVDVGQRVDPMHAGIHGFAGSMAKEFPNWRVRLVDLESDGTGGLRDWSALTQLPEEWSAKPLAHRHGQWFRREFIPVNDLSGPEHSFRRNGVYVVVGGAGGIGRAWSRWLIERYQAQVVWIGRRAKDSSMQKEIDSLAALGPAPYYISADATDRQSLQAAHDEIKRRFQHIHGVVHSAIVLKDGSLANLTPEQFNASLAVNVDVCVRIAQVFNAADLDFVLFFSSIQSFCTFAGQSNYAAGCTFKDAFVERLRQDTSCAVKVVNWGYWGSVGVVATDYYRESMALKGLGSIEPEEAFELLARFVAAPLDQLAIVKMLRKDAMDGIVEDEQFATDGSERSKLRNWLPPVAPFQSSGAFDGGLDLPRLTPVLASLLWGTVQALGFSGRNQAPVSSIRSAIDRSGKYHRWIDESLAFLERLNYIQIDGDICVAADPTLVQMDAVWKEWEVQRESYLASPETKSQVCLLEACLRNLQDILTGQVPATDVLFPDSSADLTAGVYKNNRIADYFNGVVAAIVKAYVDKRVQAGSSSPIRILEIGAGTGGTTTAILSALTSSRGAVSEYCFTDLSPAFLNRAQEQFGRDWPNLATCRFDVERPLKEQSIALANYDVVVAANVLHATRDIRNAIRNAKAALRTDGVLVLNEFSANTMFLHLTFGLLKGWWLYEDAELRLPGCPGLSPQAWRDVLGNEGFRSIALPAIASQSFGQQIIVAESDGVIRQRQPAPTKKQQSVPAVARVEPSIISVPDSMLENRVRAIVREAIAANLRMEEAEIQDSRVFSDYGVDSIIGVQLINQINKTCNISMPATALFDYSNVNELSAYVTRQFRSALLASLFNSSADSGGPPKITPKSSAVDDVAVRHIMIEGPGQVAELEISESAVRPLQNHEIRVAVRASSLNFSDLLCVKGLYPNMPPYPFVPGVEASGIVMAVGPLVRSVVPGDAVVAFMGKKLGAHATILVCSDDDVMKKPDGLSFEEACALPAVGITMIHAFRKAQVRRGETILIQTATGGTGLIAVQLAQHYGAEVFATAGSREKLDHLRKLGVRHTINYREADFEAEIGRITQGRGVDVVINTLSGDALQKGLKCLSPGGRYVEIAMTALKSARTIDLSVLHNNQSFYAVDLLRLATEDRETFVDCYNELMSLVGRGIVRPTIGRVVPFDNIKEAYRCLEDRRNIGKVVIAVSEHAATISSLPHPSADWMPIAVIGMSGRFPKSRSLPELWKHLAAGDNLVDKVERWDLGRAYAEDGQDLRNSCYDGALLEDIDRFDPLFFDTSALEATHMDPQQRLFLEEAWKALEDAGHAGAATEGKSCGVYVGCTNGDYSRLRPKHSPAHTFWGNAGSVIPARIAYYLNLRGPAIAIDTACSSSLVAMHLACEALRAQQIELALAGGVFVQSTEDFYVSSNRAGMLSPKGRCHAFDDRADGFVPGEGVGVVVLKRLDHAIRDGDHVYGVIRGSGLNQDGKTNGITAPSANSQERLERQVYETFGIHPDRIQMIEAHGTGTKLGDPIEFEALTKAFRKDTERRQFCAIGSIKSNLGHTATAAGVAGVLKILLSLQHKQIPPTLNFDRGNRSIAFDESPFYANTHLKDWDIPHGQARCAAISSFGFSGTNAHMVIEEPPSTTRSHGPRPAFLIVLSARTAAQLQRQAEQLLDFCQEQPQADIGNMSFTLLVGRRHSTHRFATVVRDVEELTGYLQKWLQTKHVAQVQVSEIAEDRKDDASLREFGNESIRICARTPDAQLYWTRLAGVATLFSQGYALDFTELFAQDGYSRIPLPTYPFSAERYWVDVEANARSSFGRTGRSNAFLHPLLHRNCSTLGAQLYRSEFVGEEFFLKDHQLDGKRVMPAVAYLEMAIAASVHALSKDPSSLRVDLKNIVWATPLTVTGKPEPLVVRLVPRGNTALDFEITNDPIHENVPRHVYCQGTLETRESENVPTMDAESLREIRRAGREIPSGECYDAFERMGITYGPAHRGVESIAISGTSAIAELSLPETADATAGEYYLHPSVMDAALQGAVALLAPSAGLQLPYAADEVVVHRSTERRMRAVIRMRPPTDDSRLTKLDIDIFNPEGLTCVSLKGLALRSVDRSFAVPAAVRAVDCLVFQPRLESKPAITGGQSRVYAQHHVILCRVDAIAEEVLSVHGAQPRIQSVRGANPIEEYFEKCVVELVKVTQSILNAGAAGEKLLQIVVRSSHEPEESRTLSALSAAVRTIRQEDPSILAQLIEVEPPDTPTSIAMKLNENSRTPQDPVIVYRNGRRQVATWQELSQPPSTLQIPWRDGGVYLITGGSGGLGRVFVREICGHVRGAKIFLASRSLVSSQLDGVYYRQTDVRSKDSIDALLRHIREEAGELNGVVHCAGTLRDSLCLRKTEEEIRQVLGPKVAGLVNLDRATQDIPLDFFICFSSVAGALGNAGQIDYAAANAFMDEFAHLRTDLVNSGNRFGKTLSINWPLWKDGGMPVSADAENQMHRSLGMTAMPETIGLEAFYRCYATGPAQLMVMHGEGERIRKAVYGPAEGSPLKGQTALATSSKTVQEKAGAYIRTVIASVLQFPVERLKDSDPFERYGIDSLLAVNLTAELEKTFGSLSKILFFEHNNIRSLTEYLLRNHGDQFAKAIGQETPTLTARPAEGQVVPSDRPVPERSDALDIAIVGVSGRYPGARSIDEFWENLKIGKDCISEIPANRWDHQRLFDPDKAPGTIYTKWGGFIDGVEEFDPLFFNITPREAEFMDPQERLFLQCAYETIEDAGYLPGTLGGAPDSGMPPKVGVFVGVMYEEYQLFGVEETMRGRPMALSGSPAAIANRVSYFCNFSGPCMVIDTMCSSSLTAVHLACQSLRLGECVAAIAGGVNVSIHPNKYLLLSQGRFASSAGRCESFGQGGDGYVPGEGVGAVLLKPLAAALRDGDHIYGVIKGTAVNHGGKTNGFTVPNPNAQSAMISQAIKQSRVHPRSITYIEAHGTGTALGDPIEIAGLTKAFRDATPDRQYCAIGSVKSNIGHCESAAGIGGVTKVLLQLKHRQLVPSLHSETLNPRIDFSETPFVVQQELAEWKGPRIAGVSSFGAGGSNAHIIIEESSDRRTAVHESSGLICDQDFLILLSAKTEDRLEAIVRNLHTYLPAARASENSVDLRDLAYTLQVGRVAMEERLAFSVTSYEELKDKLESILNRSADSTAVLRGNIHHVDNTIKVMEEEGALDESLSKWLREGRLSRLAQMWVNGVDVEWGDLYSSSKPRRVSLPAYPFERGRYWVPGQAKSFNDADSGPETVVLQKEWRTAAVLQSKSKTPGTVAVLGTRNTSPLARLLFADTPAVQVIELLADAPSSIDGNALFTQLTGKVGNNRLLGIIDCTALDSTASGASDDPAKVQLLQLLIDRYGREEIKLLQLVSGLYPFQSQQPRLEGARMAGLYRMIRAEYRRVESAVIDVDCDLSQISELATVIAQEFFSGVADGISEVCYRGGVRYQPHLAPSVRKPNEGGPGLLTRIGPEDVFLVTGGTRGIGAAVVLHLLSKGARRFVLLGREPLPPQPSWERDAPSSEKLAFLSSLLKKGVRVRYFNTPLTDSSGLESMLRETHLELGSVTGVFHCAGTSGENPAFVKKTSREIATVCEPKIQGLIALDRVLRNEPLRCFVLFSSVASAIPSLAAGQSDYAMANAFLDFYALHEALRGRHFFKSIQWPAWGETGMAAGKTDIPSYTRTGLMPLTTEHGLMLLDSVLAVPGVVCLPAVLKDKRLDYTAWLSTTFGNTHPDKGTEPKERNVVSEGGAARRDGIVKWLREVFMAELRLSADQLRETRRFDEYGVDSVMVAQLVQVMQERVKAARLSPSLLLEHTSIAALADYFAMNHAQEFVDTSVAETRAMVATASAGSIPTIPSIAVNRIPETATSVSDTDIAVVGISCRLPGAPSKTEFWNALTAGHSALERIKELRWKTTDDRLLHGGWLDEIDGFDPAFFNLGEQDAAIMDPQARLLLEESLFVFYDAGYEPKELFGQRVGVYIGGRAQISSDMNAILKAPNPILGVGQNYLATNISRVFNLNGPSVVVDTACSSAITGMQFASDALRNRRIDLAMVGTASLLLTPDAHRLFAERKILSESGEFRIFDRRAGGEVLGEGVGMVMLKRLEDAIADGNHVYGVIKAISMNNDGRTLGPGSPNIHAQREVMVDALRSAGIRAEQVGYIEVNGGGSAVVDAVEIKSVSDVYRLTDRSLEPCFVGSVKPNVGHLLLASGLAGFIRCVLSVHHKSIPPSLTAIEPFDYYDFSASRIRFNREAIPWEIGPGQRRIAAQNSYPDGGTNAHVLVEEFVPVAAYVQKRFPKPAPPLSRKRFPVTQAPSTRTSVAYVTRMAKADVLSKGMASFLDAFADGRTVEKSAGTIETAWGVYDEESI